MSLQPMIHLPAATVFLNSSEPMYLQSFILKFSTPRTQMEKKCQACGQQKLFFNGLALKLDCIKHI